MLVMGGEDGTNVAVCEDGEVVPFYIHETEDDVFPSVNKQQLEVLLWAIFPDRICGIKSRENDVVEQCLESWDRSALVDEQCRKGIRGSDAEGKDLSVISR
jgi:hypothetical protein